MFVLNYEKDVSNLIFLHFYSPGDIDPEFNVVEVTEEAKAELAKIENKIGDYICQLCKEIYDDAFGLAQHRYVFFNYLQGLQIY